MRAKKRNVNLSSLSHSVHKSKGSRKTEKEVFVQPPASADNVTLLASAAERRAAAAHSSKPAARRCSGR